MTVKLFGQPSFLPDTALRGGGGGYVPLDGTEPGVVFAVNFNNERVDQTGNHTVANNVLYTANQSYDGLRHVAELPGNSASRVFTDSGTAHQIATASPVSYGGMFYITTANTDDNGVHISSSQGTGSSNQNYGVRWKGTQTAYQRIPGAVNFTQSSGLDQWVHVCVVEPAGRATAKLYINGILQDTSSPAATGTPNIGDEIWLGELAGAPGTNAAGWCSDVFISNLELSNAQVLQFATNAFGGTPPAAP